MKELKRFFCEEEANGVVEVVLILVVLIAMVALFKDKLEPLMKSLLDKVDKNARKI